MSWLMTEWLCPFCGTHSESLERRSEMPASVPCPCGAQAERTISAVASHFPIASISRGKSEPPPPGCVSTAALADGMPMSEWRAARAKEQREARRAQLGIQPKVYVGA